MAPSNHSDDDSENDHEEEEEEEQEEPGDEVECDRSGSSSDGDENLIEVEIQEEKEEENLNKDEYILVDLASVRKEFQCAICLGVIRKTRTVMECLHRFCRQCIDKAIRTGKNECPTCRAHCASRRSLRDDPNYDALISAIYPDIDKYEAQELALREEEINRNKKTQDSFAKTLQRQTEAAGSKRRKARATAAAFVRSQETILEGGGGGEEETKPPQESAPVASETGDENISDVNREISSPGTLVCGEGETQFPQETEDMDVDETDDEYIPYMSIDISSYGSEENDDQSNTEVDGESARSSRITSLINHLRNSEADEVEMEIPLKLVSLDEQRIPNLQEPYICCKPSVSLKTLRKYVALKTEVVQADEVELCLVEDPQAYILGGERSVDDINKDKLRVLGDEETLGELYTPSVISRGPMILAYKMK
ncbi:putative E3 ubiquitin-protein ligase RING1b isoform X2 [Cajanus cajan]|uniref:putative E3 ubiquitin-protein ligase RING1b isoform X2 n=1 Tax=Cajanus cajan TaxID=3821 RepID=UPI00098D8590|nr:putative E3 ubiquitin-protein ligase RING1b isoform X2 [Cajanus cajan]